jgi:hypothetical protein
MEQEKDVTLRIERRGKVLPRKTDLPRKAEDSEDPEHLQMMDENNTEWVAEWKRVVKPKKAKNQAKKVAK